MGRQIEHQREAKHGDEEQRDARDAGCNLRRIKRDRDKRAKKREPADGDVGVAHMPAVQIQISEQKDQKRRDQNCFAGGAPDAFGARRHVEHLAPEAEIDPDIDENRPAESGGGGKHDTTFHHEQDREKQRQQAGDADDDALIERQRVDLVLERVRLPQIELRQIRAAQFGDESDDRSGIERDAKDVGGWVFYSLGRIARRRRDVGDA